MPNLHIFYTMHILVSLVMGASLCGIGNRLRGGLAGTYFPTWGDTTTRIVFWGGACGLTAWIAGMSWWAALLVIPCMWIGSTVGNFNSIDVGTPTDWTKVGWMTLHGVLWTLPVSVLMVFTKDGWPVTMIAGLLCGLMYVVAYDTKVSAPVLGAPKQDRVPIAELLFGMLVGVAMVLAVAVRPWPNLF